jgi:hypothetical protein
MMLKLGLALLVIFGGRQCDIDIGNLDELVVTNDITVTNAGPGVDAVVNISGKDVKRRAIVKAGASVTASSFGGGTVLIAVTLANDVVGPMKARRDALVAQLDAKPLDLAKTLEIYRQLENLNGEIRAWESERHGSLCTVELKKNSKGKGIDVSVTATFVDGTRFDLAC